MSRVKGGVGAHRRHKRLFKLTKGFWQQRKNIYRRAHETLMRAWAFAFKGRKLKKRTMRALFISRISAATKQYGMSYSVFMHRLKLANITLNRKMLSQMAILEAEAFKAVVSIAEKLHA
ncbi:50S ribosomal protein L20 [bacterium]|nr:MAG: 50S ribosomal protein L20 [bacterium]QQR61839.1 MAG: 50S ribosomal protein L20 [bacterium]QQR62579.1 MAG: 50S ribosomal protein L20 [bacterium]